MPSSRKARRRSIMDHGYAVVLGECTTRLLRSEVRLPDVLAMTSHILSAVIGNAAYERSFEEENNICLRNWFAL
nr:hypothetical protein CFP56_65211 [Quercus suber]